MDYVFRKSISIDDAYTVRRRLSSRKPEVKIPALAYADDAALISNTAEGAERQLHKFEEVSASIGLSLNSTKTETMFVGDADHIVIHTLSGNALNECSNFCYLGNEIANPRGAFIKRRQLAWTAAKKLIAVWESNVSNKVKGLLFDSCVQSVLLYSIETLPLTQTLKAEIDASHRALLRFCLGIHFPQRVSNEDLYTLADIKPASKTLLRKRLQLYGYALRRPDIPLAIILSNPATEPFRRGGHLRFTYEAQLQKDLRKLNLTVLEASYIAQDRGRWQSLIAAAR